MFDKKIEYPEDLPLLENDRVSRRTFFKVTIEKVEEVTKPQTEEKYLHNETKKIISGYGYRNEIEKDSQKDYLPVKVETGGRSIDSNSKDIYEQKFDEMDVSEIVLFLNRTK